MAYRQRALFGLAATLSLDIAIAYAIDFYLDRAEDRHMARALADLLEHRPRLKPLRISRPSL